MNYLLSILLALTLQQSKPQTVVWDYDPAYIGKWLKYFSVMWDGVGNSVGLPYITSDTTLPGMVSFGVPRPMLTEGTHRWTVGACADIVDPVTGVVYKTDCAWAPDVIVTCTLISCSANGGVAIPPPPAPSWCCNVIAESPAVIPQVIESSDGDSVPPKFSLVDKDGHIFELVGINQLKSATVDGNGTGADGVGLTYKNHVVYLYTGSWYYWWNGSMYISYGPALP